MCFHSERAIILFVFYSNKMQLQGYYYKHLTKAENQMNHEQQLIKLVQGGKTEAFGELVQQHMKPAYYLALGMTGSHDDAMDLSQTAFVKAFRAINTFDPSKKFSTWYYQILRNLFLNFLRDNKRHARPFSKSQVPIENIPDLSNNAEEDVERQEIKDVIWQALNSLKPHEREIIIFKEFQDMSYQDIAEVLNCPIGTVMSRLYTARKSLRHKLEGYYND